MLTGTRLIRKKVKSVQIYIPHLRPLFLIIMGCATKFVNTWYASNIIRIVMLYFYMTNCYNIGKMLFGFYVNLAKSSTDITLEIHENCT
jgi:hypothetical protein